jgi:hypothetical protein
MHADFAPLTPATYGQTWVLCAKPPLNFGSPKAPPQAPPAMAPPRADEQSGEDDAARLAARKKGLRRTMMQDLAGTPEQGQTLGAPTALGSYKMQ